MKTIFLILITTIAFTGCINEPQLPALKSNYQLSENIALDLYEEVSISQENIHIAFSKVKDESRCPTTWKCLWEGETEIELTIQKGELTEKIQLKYNGGNCIKCGNSTTALGYNITLEKLTPYPNETFYAKKPLNFEDYKIIISIEHDNSEILS